MKKLNLVAAVLGVVGVAATVYSSMYSEANALLSLTACILWGILGVALCVVPNFVKNDLVSLACSLGSIASLMVVVNNTVSERILMIAGIFSYNSQDQVGWTVFYIMIVGVVGLVLSCVSTMVASFLDK